jgi:cysteine desulfurase
MVNPDDLAGAICDDTAIVSVMAANNEIGTLQPIGELAKIANDRGALFHTDAVQAVGSIPVDVAELGVDMLSLAAHKFYGPKGTGALFIKTGTRIEHFVHGGSQERGRRAGTENVAGIVGLAEALKIAVRDLDAANSKIVALRDRTIREITEKIPFTSLNGHPVKRLPNNAHFAVRFVEGESLLLMLDMKGIGASSGSACTAGSIEPSHVLLAIGLPPETAHGSLRLTFGIENADSDVDYLLEILPPIVNRLREMSPLYEDYMKSDINSR